MKYVAIALLLIPRCGAVIAEELLVTTATPGRYGGDLVVAECSEPKTLNPVLAADNVSRGVTQLMMADLVHINRESHCTEMALAHGLDVSPDGRRYVVHLRRGIRFSDGHPFDADDVVFSFQVYLDEKIHSSMRDPLIVGGKPVSVHKQDADTVIFEFAEPYGPGDRLFDGIAMLPRHLLNKPYLEQRFPHTWDLSAAPGEIAGLGPFRFNRYVPGQRLVLEKNPYYWKKDTTNQRLPYLSRVIFDYVGSEDAQVLRFQSGAADIVSRISARNFEILLKEPHGSRKLADLGPSLEYNFLFFNLNDLSHKKLPSVEARQSWFRNLNFRRAVSAAVDRESIARLVYAGRATPIWMHVTRGNKLWVTSGVPAPPRSIETARALMASAGFSWNGKGALVDPSGRPVEFSIVTNAGNSERLQMATLIQHDLQQMGIAVHVVSLEFRSMLDRIMNTFDYDSCVLGLASGDVDPSSEMNVWNSDGSMHLWELSRTVSASSWQTEIDHLMTAQMRSINPAERKRYYDRVQQLVAEYLPIICLVSPTVLVGARADLENFRPAILLPYTLWNAEELFWRPR